jgi:hypothetical protein
MKRKGDGITDDIFDYLEPTSTQIEEVPDKDKVRDILILGWLNMFTDENKYKASDRNKAGEIVAKIYGLITDKKQIDLTGDIKTVQQMTDDELDRVISGG